MPQEKPEVTPEIPDAERENCFIEPLAEITGEVQIVPPIADNSLSEFLTEQGKAMERSVNIPASMLVME